MMMRGWRAHHGCQPIIIWRGWPIDWPKITDGSPFLCLCYGKAERGVKSDLLPLSRSELVCASRLWVRVLRLLKRVS